jgi:hypothetical protein
MHAEATPFCTQWEVESRLKKGTRFLLVAFVRSGTSVSVDYSEKLYEFAKSLNNLDIGLVFVDVHQDAAFAVSHRISISPTLVVFDSGSRVLTQICSFNFEDLKLWLQHR